MSDISQDPKTKICCVSKDKKALELLKVNLNLKVFDTMFAARFLESEATSEKIHKRVLRLRNELPNKNSVAKLKKPPSLTFVVK